MCNSDGIGNIVNVMVRVAVSRLPVARRIYCYLVEHLRFRVRGLGLVKGLG